MPFSGSILIIEPDAHLHTPYRHFPVYTTIDRLESVDDGIGYLYSAPLPDLVCLSCSFKLAEQVLFLDSLKSRFTTRIVPLMLVLNLSQRISTVPGTVWAGQIGILHSLSSRREVNAALRRLFS